MIHVEDLSFAYHKNQLILDRIAFDANHGECIAVLGNNGAGKSTMVKCLNRILSPLKGSIIVSGVNLHSLSRPQIAKTMSYVSQATETSSICVYDAVLLGRKPHIKINPTKEDHHITEAVIKRMGIEALALQNIDELSGGQVQKVMLARALAQKPQVLILDEPTSNLDLKNQYDVLNTVKKISREDNLCVIMVIHDLNLALRYCDRFLLIKDKTVYAYGDHSIMTRQMIEDVYEIKVTTQIINGYQTVIPV